jgi:hypothetical protein
MPAFTFTSPQGKSYTVEGPEGATKEQAFGILQQQLAGPKMGPKDIPDSAPQGAPGASPPVQENRGLPEKIEGALEAGASMASSATTGLLGRAGGMLGGLAGQVATGQLGTQEGAAGVARTAEEGAQKMTFSPSNLSAQDYLGMVQRAIEISKIEGLGPTEALAMASAPAKQAATQAGKAVAPEVAALKGIPGKIADLVTPTPSKEIEALAAKAEGMGIELRPDMLSNNRIAKMMGEALEQVPLSGSKAEQRQIAFNTALTKIIGGDDKAKRLTPDVFDQAMTASGEKIGQISKETPITVSPELKQTFTNRVLEAEKFETADVAKIVKNYVTELGAAATDTGVIPGEQFRKINSKLGRQIRSTNNGDLKNALYGLQQEMHDALESNIKSPERLAELKDARFKYAMGKIIEPLVAKAKGGDISPAGLMGAVTSDSAKKTMMARGRGGEIGDLARIGQAFLKEPPSSGTGERLGAYSLLTAGTVAEPHTAAGLVTAANLYNRLGPALTKRAIRRRSIDPAENQPWSGTDPVSRLSE